MRTRSSIGFNAIPENVAAVVFSHLGDDPRDRVALAQVSKVWRDAEKSDASLPGGSTRALLALFDLYNYDYVYWRHEPAKYEYWCRVAADRGDPKAMCLMAQLVYRSNQAQKAFEWFKRASECGHSYATYRIATCYERGEGVLENEAKAIELFIKAATEHGSTEAACHLGHMYNVEVYRVPYGPDFSWTSPKKEALKWFRVAVELGDSGAKYLVAKFEAELAAMQTN